MSFRSNLQPSTVMLCGQMLLLKMSIAGCDSFKSLITFSERKAMVLAFGYALSIEHSAFSTLCIFNTPHFQHSAFSTLRIFNTPGLRTPGLQHSAFSCKPIANGRKCGAKKIGTLCVHVSARQSVKEVK